MCDSPMTKDGFTFACRNCNSCLGVRRWQWVARGMAEKAIHKSAWVITLTYDNETQENRDSAAMFNYRDVQLFLKKVRFGLFDNARKEAKRKRAEFLKKGFQGPPRPKVEAPSIRYIVAGEQGERTGRCHWHIVLFSNGDLSKVGTYSDLDGKQVTGRDIISGGRRVTKLHWSCWGRGFVAVQEPDSSGLNYVLKYCMKDNFIVDKSRDTGRLHKAENFGTGFFRMSKSPPLGMPWWWEKAARLRQAGAVLPEVKLTVPGLPGYWVPSGDFRKTVVKTLREINDFTRAKTGQDAPQWRSLLNACRDIPTDMEILIDKAPEEIDTAEGFATEIKYRAAEADRSARIGETVRRCGRVIPCWRCLNGFSEDKLGQLGLKRYTDHRGFAGYAVESEGKNGVKAYERLRKTFGAGANPGCQLVGSKQLREAFPSSGQAPRS